MVLLCELSVDGRCKGDAFVAVSNAAAAAQSSDEESRIAALESKLQLSAEFGQQLLDAEESYRREIEMLNDKVWRMDQEAVSLCATCTLRGAYRCVLVYHQSEEQRASRGCFCAAESELRDDSGAGEERADSART
jgi:hypothetical protein